MAKCDYGVKSKVLSEYLIESVHRDVIKIGVRDAIDDARGSIAVGINLCCV